MPLRFRSGSDYDLVPMVKGDHYIELKLGEFPLFIKKGRAIPLGSGGENIDELKENDFQMLGWEAKGAEYELYQDDGRSTYPTLEGHQIRRASCRERG